jgi:glycerol-3-phosphate acyltransferase PlsY
LLGFSYLLGLAFVGTWLVMYKVGRISSLSALIASALSPLYAWFIVGDMAVIGVSGVMMVFLLWRHKANIERLLAGQEG